MSPLTVALLIVIVILIASLCYLTYRHVTVVTSLEDSIAKMVEETRTVSWEYGNKYGYELGRTDMMEELTNVARKNRANDPGFRN